MGTRLRWSSAGVGARFHRSSGSTRARPGEATAAGDATSSWQHARPGQDGVPGSAPGRGHERGARDCLGPLMCGGVLERAPLRLETVAAVDGLAAVRAERHLGLAAAARARCAEHLPLGPIVAAGRVAAARVAAVRGAARGLPAGTARRAATRLAELAIGEELLLARGERELLAAVDAGQRLVPGVREQRRTPSRADPSEPVLAEDR